MANKQPKTLPFSRREGVVVRDLSEETVVYDVQTHRAHCLNRTAALVWRHCDGETTVEEMADILHRELSLPVDESVVQMALNQLAAANLLEGRFPVFCQPRSRREAILAGLSAVLLPAVLSITAPRATAAASPSTFPPGPTGPTGTTGGTGTTGAKG